MFGFLDSLKQQSEKLLEVYTKDITEFASQLTVEAAPVTKILLGDEEDSSTDTNDKTVTLTSRSETPFEKLQREDATYFNEISSEEMLQFALNIGKPTESEDEAKKIFEEYWNDKATNLDAQTEKITNLVETNALLKDKFAELVPEKISYSLFWQRFLVRYEQLIKDEERKQKLQNLKQSVNEDYFSWDEEDKLSSTLSPTDHKIEFDNMKKEIQLLKAMQSNSSIQIKERALSEWISLYDSKIKKLEEEISKMKEKKSSSEQSSTAEPTTEAPATTTSQTKEEIYDDWE